MPSVDINISKDTFLEESNPTTAFGNSTAVRLGQGNFVTLPAITRRAILDVSLASIPADQVIVNAELHLWVTNSVLTSTPVYRWYELLSTDVFDWVEGQATWNIKATALNWNTLGGDYEDVVESPTINMPVSSGGWHVSPVTLLAQRAYAAGRPLKILGRKVNESSNAYFEFSSRTHGTSPQRPFLRVEYEPPPPPAERLGTRISSARTSRRRVSSLGRPR